jgi:hypothetical protein
MQSIRCGGIKFVIALVLLVVHGGAVSSGSGLGTGIGACEEVRGGGCDGLRIVRCRPHGGS